MAITISKQPTSKAGFEGDTVYFTVEATGVSAYLWEYSPDGGISWSKLYWDGATTDALTFTANKTRAANIYRCKLEDDGGNVVYTIAVTLTVLDVTSVNGLVSSETLAAIGDAIREKTGDVARMLPADMPAMIRSIGGRPIYTGYLVGDGGISATYSLGVSLPEYDNYSFIVMPTDGVEYYCGVKMVLGVISLDYLRTPASISLDGWNIDFAKGTIQHQFFNPGNASYKWWYFEEDIGQTSAAESDE